MAMVEEEKEEEIEEEEDEEEEIERTWGEHGPSVLQPSSAVPARARHRLACGWKSSLVGRSGGLWEDEDGQEESAEKASSR